MRIMMRCAILINECQRRESVVVSVSMLLRVGGVDDQLDYGNTSQYTVPHDSATGHAEWHCYAAFASGQRERAKEAARISGGPPQRHERLARPLCVRVQHGASQCIISRNGTLTPGFAVSRCGVKSHTKRRRGHWRERAATRETDKPRREITCRAVNACHEYFYGGILDSIV